MVQYVYVIDEFMFIHYSVFHVLSGYSRCEVGPILVARCVNDGKTCIHLFNNVLFNNLLPKREVCTEKYWTEVFLRRKANAIKSR